MTPHACSRRPSHSPMASLILFTLRPRPECGDVGSYGCFSETLHPWCEPSWMTPGPSVYKPRGGHVSDSLLFFFLSLTTHRMNSANSLSDHPMIPLGSLRHLRNLDRTSPRFHEELSDFLHGDEYQNFFSRLRNEDLVWLAEYLDNAGLRPFLPILRSLTSL